MPIDSHQHFWLYDPVRDAWINDDMGRIRGDFLPEDLMPTLAANGVEGCVAVQADQSEAETMFLLALAEKYGSVVKGVVGWVDLKAKNLYDKLEEFSQYENLKGFRHVVQAEPDDFMMNPEFVRGVRQLSAFDFTYDILIFPTQLGAALHLVEQVPEVKFVIDHIAKPYIKNKDIDAWAKAMQALAKYPHVSCKVSGMVTEADWKNWQPTNFYPYLDVVFEAFGTDRLLYGSDWPVCLVAAEYEQVIGLVKDYMTAKGISENEQSKVLGLNAIQFYGL